MAALGSPRSVSSSGKSHPANLEPALLFGLVQLMSSGLGRTGGRGGSVHHHRGGVGVGRSSRQAASGGVLLTGGTHRAVPQGERCGGNLAQPLHDVHCCSELCAPCTAARTDRRSDGRTQQRGSVEGLKQHAASARARTRIKTPILGEIFPE